MKDIQKKFVISDIIDCYKHKQKSLTKEESLIIKKFIGFLIEEYECIEDALYDFYESVIYNLEEQDCNDDLGELEYSTYSTMVTKPQIENLNRR